MQASARLEDFLESFGIKTMPAGYGISPSEWAHLVDKALEGERGRNFIGNRP